MQSRQVRCYRGYAAVHGRWNIEVLYTMPDMGYYLKLVTCVECGTIFVINFANLNFSGKTIEEIAGDSVCPKCGLPLGENIQPYPDVFRTDDGIIGSFDPGRRIPPDSESFVEEFLEID
jgi:hypothetical protein